MADDGVVDRVRKLLAVGLTPPHEDVKNLLAMLDEYSQVDQRLLTRLAPLHTQVLEENDRDLVEASVKNLVALRRRFQERGRA